MHQAEPEATADRQDPTWKKVAFHFVLWALVIPGLACIALAVLSVTEPPSVDIEAGVKSIDNASGSLPSADCGGSTLQVVFRGPEVDTSTGDQTQRIERACVKEARLEVAGAFILLITSIPLLIAGTLVRDRLGGRDLNAPLIPY
jgi:hypothetical protein